jgi:hypothetical protein
MDFKHNTNDDKTDGYNKDNQNYNDNVTKNRK